MTTYHLKLTMFLLFIGLSMSIKAQVALNSEQQSLELNLQKRISSESDIGEYLIKTEPTEWKTSETAIIICDMWDQHWCKGASERTAEMAPNMNEVVSKARENKILIVHSPGGCMKFYKNHPARKNVLNFKKPAGVNKVNSAKLPSEKNAVWPIDDSDGGCDCSPECEQHHPWKRQIDIIQIKENDVITDSGEELLAYFNAVGIKKVILMGVHTNMCIINRPYGLRSMINLGIEAVLMRDLTDSMYDSKQSPFVSHFDGTRLMIEYIEKYICPSFVSTDLSGQKPFRFKGDN